MQWIEERIRKRSNAKDVYVVSVGPEHNCSWDIERTKARFANGQWFVQKGAKFQRVVLWLESSRALTDEEAFSTPLPQNAHFSR